jgi:hypothetical protein
MHEKQRKTKEQNKQLVNFFSFRIYVEKQFILKSKDGTASILQLSWRSELVVEEAGLHGENH